MVQQRVRSERPLTAKGFLESDAVTALRKNWAENPKQVKICELLLKNWRSTKPTPAQKFLIEHVKLRQEFQFIPSVCYREDSGVHSVTPHGLAFMAAIGVPGAKAIANQWNRIYVELRRRYVKSAKEQLLSSKELAHKVELDLDVALKGISAIADMGMANLVGHASVAATTLNMPVSDIEGSKIPTPTDRILDNADLWSLFELMAETLPGSDTPISPTSIALPVGLSYSVDLRILAICPSARDFAEKALERMMPDPAGAITAARSLVETVVKWVAHETGISDAIANVTTNKAVKMCFSAIGGGGDFDKPGISEVILGMQGALNGLDSARNSMADSHGPGPTAHAASTRISTLLVGLAINSTIFLLQSFDASRKP